MRVGCISVLISILSSTSAQINTPALSFGCQSAALSLVSAGIGNCLNVISLVSLFSSTGSVTAPLTSFLNGACSQTCSQSDLDTALNSIKTGCASDIAAGNTAPNLLQFLLGNYAGVKDTVCLQATSNATFCLTNVIATVESATGKPVTVDALIDLPQFATTVGSLPATSVCTDCLHGLVSKAKVIAPAGGANSSSITQAVGEKCGAVFVDGKIPSTLAAYGTSTSTPSAVTSKSLNGAPSLGMGKTVIGAAVGLFFVGCFASIL